MSDPLSVEERGEADRLTSDLTAMLERAGLGDRAVVLQSGNPALLLTGEAPPEIVAVSAEIRRLAELRAVGQRCVLYLFDDPR